MLWNAINFLKKYNIFKINVSNTLIVIPFLFLTFALIYFFDHATDSMTVMWELKIELNFVAVHFDFVNALFAVTPMKCRRVSEMEIVERKKR